MPTNPFFAVVAAIAIAAPATQAAVEAQQPDETPSQGMVVFELPAESTGLLDDGSSVNFACAFS
ncbi:MULTISPECIES: hypothetical protein [unclassified Solwaraspora]|uniref:hypothetical protein n=1 Tax=unclassified Solwaraspora TaxID=2627926 RepID=UPI00248B4E6F|nr:MULTISPECIES: hypothetical protein [unclassified Solwaraspora]WBB98453.1 hypothetical protein O7553_05885 [Solwaraspora sp. WMMA2059]WBC22994.1 hypothetical protein O7543_11480 [Solwaraspora sp. WMMA2080]WJK34972.1 hypothetical protein O7610_00720 [Solwaraspora sp. WMMA2065]